MCILINQSLTTGIFPSNFKKAKLLPLQKEPNNCHMENFRPISLLPTISKIMEKCVFNQVFSYFENNKLLYDSQYGYRKEHSTETACLEIIDKLNKQLDKKEIPLCIFIDLSKAFDTLDHRILLSKLKYYGMDDISLYWFKSYLSNRHQFVEIEGYKSKLKQINTGVPQGSILGPLLFIIYMNDINFVSNTFEAIIFADDTTLNSVLSLFSKHDKSNLSGIINKEINKLYDWMKANKLSLNIKKTKYMVFRYPQKSRHSLPKLSIKINDVIIERVDQFKFLGIIIHETLSWKFHTDMIRMKISKVVGVMRRLRNYISTQVLLKIYNALILSHLHYGILCWGFTGPRLFKVQKKAIRVICKRKYNSHTDPLFKKLKLTKINDIFKTKCLTFLFNLKKGKVPAYFRNTFKFTGGEHNYNTRNRDRIQPTRTNKKTTDKTLRQYIPVLTETIPNSIMNKIDTHSLQSLKRNTKLFFIEKYESQCNKPNCYICSNNR